MGEQIYPGTGIVFAGVHIAVLKFCDSKIILLRAMNLRFFLSKVFSSSSPYCRRCCLGPIACCYSRVKMRVQTHCRSYFPNRANRSDLWLWRAFLPSSLLLRTRPQTWVSKSLMIWPVTNTLTLRSWHAEGFFFFLQISNDLTSNQQIDTNALKCRRIFFFLLS